MVSPQNGDTRGGPPLSPPTLVTPVVLGSSFKEFVEFLLSSAAQLLKLRLQTKPSINKYFYIKILPIGFLDFVSYIILTINLAQYPKYQIYTLN